LDHKTKRNYYSGQECTWLLRNWWRFCLRSIFIMGRTVGPTNWVTCPLCFIFLGRH